MQNTYMCSSTHMAFCRNIFEFWSFWGGYDGSRPNLIYSYARAFHKDSESGLNSKMAIGTYAHNNIATLLYSPWEKI